ncbi:hypothetical protein CRE_20949 [Caenorhabditis remanei]|uniref:Uncharacterized protein n=1 Tax=Caenorhabditis remanei TaxID=31234 RepID=E3NCR8_CAERE|nr:hypothetical protein CRE_20949 [Caenorhabditis remanei]
MSIAISLNQSKELSPKETEEEDLRIYYYPFTYFHSVLSRKIQKCSKVSEKELDMLKKKLTAEWKWKQYEVCDKPVENCTHKLQLTFITMLLCAVVSKDILDMARLDFWIQCCIFGIESVLFLVIVQKLWCQRRQINYGKKNGFSHLFTQLFPEWAILEEVGPRVSQDDDEPRERSNSKLKLLKDTVGAIREKKYVKGG